ncbi:MAG: hypothetical protein ACC613_03040 [Synergistales bacterium]
MNAFLYRARSSLENFHGLKVARVIWVPLRAERIRFGPISELLADFETLRPDELSIARGFLDEFLTPQEAAQLSQALEKGLGYPLEFEEVPVPVACRDGSGEILTPLRALPESAWRGREIVAHRGKLSLPFDVLALWRDDQEEGGPKS